MRVIVKIGTSSLTDETGAIDPKSVRKVCNDIAQLRSAGHSVILVTSAAISAGLPVLGFSGKRPKNTKTLQAAAAVGQSRLLKLYDEALDSHGLVGGQILLSPNDFFNRTQYLHVRETLDELLRLGAVPIINENDAVADDEIRFGDNDRIAALVSHAMRADHLILLTDMAGLMTADPRVDPDARVIEHVVRIDSELLAIAGPSGTNRGSGGMTSKVTAAAIASWSGVVTTIAGAARPDVCIDAIAGKSVGTRVEASDKTMTARKLWVAFALPMAGVISVDSGAAKALTADGKSLLSAGIKSADGEFQAGQGVEIVDPDGSVVARGVTRLDSSSVARYAGTQQGDLPVDVSSVVVHRDNLVALKDLL